MQSPDLLILDGEVRTTLGIIRNLARKGLSIVVGSNSPDGKMSAFSRHVKQSFSYSMLIIKAFKGFYKKSKALSP
jgi:hypothetical protein